MYNILYLEKPQSMHLDVFFVSIYDIIRMDHDVQWNGCAAINSINHPHPSSF
jgi:hypothetical protein